MTTRLGVLVVAGLLATAAQRPPVREVAAARISPDGASVAFIVTETDPAGSSSSSLWRVTFAGDAPVRHTTVEALATDPRWSPDGREIGFVSTRSGESVGRLRIVRDSGESRWVTDEAGSIGAFSWSPDGRRMAYAIRRAADVGEGVWIRGLITGQARRLLPAREVASIAWEPSGQALAVIIRDPGAATERTSVVVAPISGQSREIERSDRAGKEMVFSSDGASIVWISTDTSQRNRRSVRVAPAEGGAAKDLPDVVGWEPVHLEALAGARLSIAMAHGDESRMDVVELRTGARTTVLPSGIATLTGAPSWSADGTRYAAVGSTAEHRAEVFAGSLPRPAPRERDTGGAPPTPVRRITFVTDRRN